MKRRSRNLQTGRNRDAGLLFSWYVRRGSAGRTMMAIILATVLCAVAVLLVRVEGSQEVRTGREAARVTVLTPGSEASRRLLARVRREAPHMDRWEPVVDEALRVRMKGIEASLIAETRHEALLHPPEERLIESKLPPIIDPLRPPLPQSRRGAVREADVIEVNVHITAEADQALRERWGDPSPSTPVGDLLEEEQVGPEGLRPREFLGLNRRFLVSVNRQGVIQTCQVLDPDVRKLDDLLARWLRSQRLKPANDELVWGEIRVVVRGLRGDGKLHGGNRDD